MFGLRSQRDVFDIGAEEGLMYEHPLESNVFKQSLFECEL